MTLLTTQRTLLRRFKSTDLVALTQMMANPKVMQYTGFKTPQSDQKIQECLTKWMHPSDENLGVWAAQFQSSPEVFGWFMLTPTIDPQSPEIGFMLLEEYWGQGLTSEVANALMKYAFENLSLKRVIASSNKSNLPSIHILQKLGMTTFVYPQAATDIIYFEKKS